MMLKDLKIGAQIGLGFALVLVVMALVSFFAINGLRVGNEGFQEYRDLARDSVLSGRVQANMLMANKAARDFLDTRNEKHYRVFLERFRSARVFAIQQRGAMPDVHRQVMSKELVGKLDQYKLAAEDAFKLMRQRKRILEEELNPQGLKMRESLEAIMVSAYRDKDTEAAYLAGRALEKTLLGRLYLLKFLDDNKPQDIKRVQDELGDGFKDAYRQMVDAIQNPERKRLLQEFSEARSLYLSAFEEMLDTIQTKNELILKELEPLDGSIAEIAEQIKLSAKEDQDRLGPKVQASDEYTIQAVFVGAVIAVFLGIIISALIVRAIVRPLSELVTTVDKVQKSGNLSLRSKIESRDEVGVMSQALNRFLDSLEEKADVAKNVAKGILVTRFELLSNDDTLGCSLKEMLKGLNDKARMVNDVALGDLKTEVTLASPEDVLGESLETMLKSLQMKEKAINAIAEGNLEAEVFLASERDILAISMQRMIEILRTVTSQVDVIASGDYSVGIFPRSAKDTLGIALQRMTLALKKNEQQVELQNWLKTGQNQLNDEIRGVLEEKELASKAISFLCNYLNVQRGVFYVFHPSRMLLELISSYASDKNEPSIKTIELGEGLMGQVALNKKQMLITDVPPDYFEVSSAIGKSTAKNIVLQPFVYNDALLGVVELASFEEFDERKLDFLASVQENISIAITTAHNQGKLKELLEQTQEQTSILTQQQEELTVSRDAMERQAKDLALSSKYKSEFLANMSHELRTPLNSILLLAEHAAKNTKGNLSKKQIESAQTIFNSGHFLLELINEILDLSKIEAGKMELNLDNILLKELMVRLEADFKHMAESKGLGFETKIAKGVPKVIYSDIMRITQVLKNLLSNAIKFTEGGKITIEIRPVDSAQVFTNPALVTKETIAIAITDTGIGISNEKQKMIFEAFHQAEGGIARKYGGTGLGLSISRELARLLEGEIQMQSELKIGSTFVMFLPYRIEEKDEETESVAPLTTFMQPEIVETSKLVVKEEHQERAAILIIEDDQTFANILKEQCQNHFFRPVVALTGEKGLELVKKEKPIGIILDLKLPGLQGIEILHQLKADSNTGYIPVHIISGLRPKEDVFVMGAEDFLQKPVSQQQLDQLFQKIESVYEQKIKKVLLVEDDEVLRESIVECMEDMNVVVVEASDGEKGIAALKAQRFECMILDLMLPGMSGFEVLETIKADPGLTLPPVIVNTAKDLNKKERAILHKYTDSIILKKDGFRKKLLDKVASFLQEVSNKPSKKSESLTDPHARLKGKKILLVDDDMRNTFALSMVMTELGMTVIKGENGKVALDILAREKEVDLVLMDIMMPIMDGFEAMRQIRAQKRFVELPIIALTAKAMKKDKEDCLAAGASDYVAKPVETETLLRLMDVWIANKDGSNV